jgi:hypothetical protein
MKSCTRTIAKIARKTYQIEKEIFLFTGIVMTHSPFDVQSLAHITDTDVSRGSKITPIVTKGRAGRIMSLPVIHYPHRSSQIFRPDDRPSRLLKNSVYTQNAVGSSYGADVKTGSGGSKSPDFSPTQPRRAETRLVPSKAAVSEEARRYVPHFVWAVRPLNGSWRMENPLQ